MILGVFTLSDVLVSLVAGISVTLVAYGLLAPRVKDREVEVKMVRQTHNQARKSGK